ncbi:MAG: Lysophospholipid acyltransferase [Myxococcaceae bacterium]|nr:Lysophospholipid acyltransferase [Myxococcaceae bacterium]
MTEPVQKRGWLDMAEVGSVWGIRFVVMLCMTFGRGVARAFLRFVVFYYVLFHAGARAASAGYFRRLLARHPESLEPALREGRIGFGTAYRHFCRFAEVALDRVLIASGKRELFEVSSTGRQHLEQLARDKRGALLLGAHLGSFEAMRLGATAHSFPINMVVNFSNAQRMQSVVDQLDPSSKTRFISVAGPPLDFVLKIRECIERGEMVAILADRVGPDARSVTANFLGEPARFAAGPFILAAALHCPVYLTFGLYRGDNRYDLFCEHFADAIELPRKQREAALADTVQRYADRLEAFVQKAPFNWFNFYDFWGQS